MKKITSSVYTFADLIADDFLYVDKTEFIWKLVSRGKGLYFLSRPRRFGKSLTLSTLKAVFEGRRELFKGLAIGDKQSYDWRPYPVIHLNLGDCDARTPDDLRQYLADMLQDLALAHGLTTAVVPSQLATSFRRIITAITAQSQVVVLVDEYDKPILNVLGTDQAQGCLDVLKGLYSVIKACEPQERFVLVTGVSKFSHVSMFSELNNLTDLSMHPDFATMLGYTQQELEAAFGEHIEKAAARLEMPRGQLLDDLRAWYDGYRFEEGAEPVYNPVSVARFFDGGCKFRNFWFSTGTPSFLLKLMRDRDCRFEDILGRPVSDEAFSAFEVDRIDPLVLLYQTGYLTIRSAETEDFETLYRLDFPNREVGMSFSAALLASCSGRDDIDTTDFLASLAAALRDGDMPLLRNALDAFLAGIPYDLHRKTENNFQNIIFAIFRLLGYRFKVEQRTSSGRADAVCETRDWIYILEFKLNGDTSALDQIRDRRYFAPYLADSRRIMLVGVALDTAKGTIADWRCEELDKARWAAAMPAHTAAQSHADIPDAPEETRP